MIKTFFTPRIERGNKKTIPNLVSGFTLIELLVVIAIIGVISSAVFFAIDKARMKGRDSTRLMNIAQIKMALDVYGFRYGVLPEEAYANWETTYTNVNNFIDVLRTSSIMPKVPVDPVNNTTYYYAYYNYPAGSNGCSFTHSVLAIKKFETTNSSVGISAVCPSRNWYPEFDYSILIPE